MLFRSSGKLPPDPTTNGVYFHNHVVASFDYSTPTLTTSARSSIRFTFANIPVGSNIRIFDDGDFSSSGSVGAQKTLILTLKEDPMQSETQLEKPVLDVKVGLPAFTFTWTKVN